jgi:hypothetical protein
MSEILSHKLSHATVNAWILKKNGEMYSIIWVSVRIMVFNATFNDILVISWWSAILVFNYLKSMKCKIYCLQDTVFWRHFQKYFSYIMATNLNAGRSRSTQREPHTITGVKLMTVVVITVIPGLDNFLSYSIPVYTDQILRWVFIGRRIYVNKLAFLREIIYSIFSEDILKKLSSYTSRLI